MCSTEQLLVLSNCEIYLALVVSSLISELSFLFYKKLLVFVTE